jgi:hypothetical protein
MFLRAVCVVALLSSTPAIAQKTEWGIRTAPSAKGERFLVPPKTPFVDPSLAPLPGKIRAAGNDMKGVAAIGRQWGRVTSMHRTPEHNRRVGGVRNSYHLAGRAIDIARRPGVSHWQIAAALRAAGYHLIESLDEGDHSHFAFGGPGSGAREIRMAGNGRKEIRAKMITDGLSPGWKVVYAPAGGGNR